MKTVTVNHQTSRGQNETTTFDVYARSEVTQDEYRQIIQNAAGKAFFMSREDWEEGVAKTELSAAQMAGIRRGESFIIVRK